MEGMESQLAIKENAGFGSALVDQPVADPPAMGETWVQSLGSKNPWRRERRGVYGL